MLVKQICSLRSSILVLVFFQLTSVIFFLIKIHPYNQPSINKTSPLKNIMFICEFLLFTCSLFFGGYKAGYGLGWVGADLVLSNIFWMVWSWVGVAGVGVE